MRVQICDFKDLGARKYPINCICVLKLTILFKKAGKNEKHHLMLYRKR